MTVSPFPRTSRAKRALDRDRSKRDATFAELLQSLRAATVSLGSVFQIEELSALSASLLELQSQLHATSEHTIEGIAVRQRCQQLLESATCGLLETARGYTPPDRL